MQLKEQQSSESDTFFYPSFLSNLIEPWRDQMIFFLSHYFSPLFYHRDREDQISQFVCLFCVSINPRQRGVTNESDREKK